MSGPAIEGGRGRRLCAGAVALAVTLAGFAGGAALADAQPTKLDRLQGALDDLTSLPDGPPGASAFMTRGSKRWFVRSGVRDVDTGEPMHRNDRLRIASTSKAFSGAVALALLQPGFRLESTIGEIRPDLPEAWSGITLRELLQHTSGIPSYTSEPAFTKALIADPAAPSTPEKLLSWVADKPLGFAPGTRYRYSNTDNIVIGLMVEATSGRSYDELLRTLVFDPLKLNRTSLPSSLGIPEPFVHGYEISAAAPPVDVSEVINPGQVWASGALISTPVDMSRFIRAYAHGSLFDPAWRPAQRSFIPGFGGEPTGPGMNSVGLALYRYRVDCGVVLGHTGNFPGYTAFMAASPNGRRSAVVTVNEQLEDKTTPELSLPLKRIFRRASCVALSG